jgi:hypothetical protein
MNMTICSAMGLTFTYIDAANPEIWASLKREFGESYNEQYLRETIAHCKKHAYLDKEDRIMFETKMVKICLQTMLTMNLHNNNIEQKSLLQKL